MEKQVILNEKQFELTLNRLCYQLIENHNDFSETVLIGLQPRGIHVLKRLKDRLERILGHSVVCGNLDITFYFEFEGIFPHLNNLRIFFLLLKN